MISWSEREREVGINFQSQNYVINFGSWLIVSVILLFMSPKTEVYELREADEERETDAKIQGAGEEE